LGGTFFGAPSCRKQRVYRRDLVSTDAKTLPDNVVRMPDIYRDEPAVDRPDVELVERSVLGDGESEGFNPYDTGRLQKHKIESAND
jgi:hypothetical protein